MSAACSRGSIDICARLSIWKTPIVSRARDHRIDRGLLARAGSPASAPRRNASAIRSKPLRRQVSMPSASTSTFKMPSASRSSLSHSMVVRSSIAALTIGTTSSSRSRVMTKPPYAARDGAESRSVPRRAQAPAPAAARVGSSPACATSRRSTRLARAAPDRARQAPPTTSSERPKALPTSRMAPSGAIGDHASRSGRRARGRIAR